jgi:hypothetical protein
MHFDLRITTKQPTSMLNRRLRRYPHPIDMQGAHDNLSPTQTQNKSVQSMEAGSRIRRARREHELSWALLLHLFDDLDSFIFHGDLHRRVTLQFAANLGRNPECCLWGYTQAPRNWGKEKVTIVIYLDLDWFKYGRLACARSLPLMR